MIADRNAVTDYIESRQSPQKELLEQLRNTIIEHLPVTVIEGVAWSMPSYWEKTYLIHFQAYTKHINVYIGPEAVEHFQPLYTNLTFSKRGFKLMNQDNLPETELKVILNWLYQTYVVERK